MKHLSARSRALTLGAAAVLLLSACADDSTPAATDLSYDKSPLNEYMGGVWEDDPDGAMRAKVAAHEAVAQCMADEGFVYTVPEAGGTPAPFEPGYDLDQMDSDSWVAANGYGLSSSWTSVTEQMSDENTEYIASLSDASRSEYYAALYGTYSEGMTEEELEAYVPSVAEQGCWGLGEGKGFTPEYIDDPSFLEYVEAIDKIGSTVEKDPATAAANEKWSDCMADAGFSGFATPADPIDTLSAEYTELYLPSDGGVAQPSPQAVADLKQREISTALADRTCTEETGWDEAYLTVLYDVEKQFITDNKTWLDELVAEHGS